MLNPDQQAAVNEIGHTMVVAIPGSGKSHLSVEYAKKILSESVENAIAMLTFTDAAAGSLASRLKQSLSLAQNARAYPSTFHSMALKMWRECHGFKRLAVGGHIDIYVERALRKVRSAMDLEAAVNLIDKMGQVLDLDDIDYSTQELRLFSAYEKLVAADHKVDLNRVSRETILGLRDGSILPLSQSMGISHICADEFQDSDSLQYLFLYEHAIRGCTILVVGDDDQSIYGFRNANGVGNFRRMQQELAAKAYSLKVCYRCPSEILKVAQTLIEHNEDRIPKILKSNLDHPGEVNVKICLDSDSQYEYIASQILRSPQGWCVLARSNKEVTDIEMELAKHKLTIKRLGGKSFFDSHHIISFIKILWMFTHHNSRYLVDFLAYLHEEEDVVQTVKRMKATHQSLSEIFHQCQSHLQDNTRAILEMYLHEELKDTSDRKVNAQFQGKLIHYITIGRQQKFVPMIGAMSDILTRVAADMGSFKEAVSYFHSKIMDAKTKKSAEVGASTVVISTLHGAKGLEFPHVMIANCHTGSIPQEDKDNRGLAHYEEERRLLYVGFTRAEHSLTLTANKSRDLTYLEQAMPDKLAVALERYELEAAQTQSDGLMQLTSALKTN